MNESNFTSKRKVFAGVTLLIAIIAVMIFSAIGASIWGVELHSIEKEIAEVEAENRRLTSEIVTQMSLTNIYENSEELGYVKPENVIYVEGQPAVAQLPTQ